MAIPANEARTRRTRRLTTVAAPVLCGAAAAAAVIGTPVASMAATAPASGSHQAAAPVKATAKAAKHAAAAPVAYTVKSGDTLSSIAQRYYHDPGFWTAIYQANQGKIHYANAIAVGQDLTIPAKPAQAPAAPSDLSAPAPAPAPVSQSAPEESSAQSDSAPATGDSSFQQCVISRESGGNSQAMNSSGHYGLYQFSASTWSAYGGNPADFGNASTAEQNQVFDNAVASGGQSNWSSYDGC